MPPEAKNIYDNIPEDLRRELFQTLHESKTCKIERIVSRGHSTPSGEWLEADRDEWVILLSGAAELVFEEGNRQMSLKPGRYVLIPAGCRHRVGWTDTEQTSVWLVVWAGKNLGSRQ